MTLQWGNYRNVPGFQRLQAQGLHDDAGIARTETKMVKLLYFAALVDLVGRNNEELELPAGVTDVASLLALLRSRGGNWQKLSDEAVRVTVDRQFASPQTELDGAREIALIPARPM